MNYYVIRKSYDRAFRITSICARDSYMAEEEAKKLGGKKDQYAVLEIDNDLIRIVSKIVIEKLLDVSRDLRDHTAGHDED